MEMPNIDDYEPEIPSACQLGKLESIATKGATGMKRNSGGATRTIPKLLALSPNRVDCELGRLRPGLVARD